MLKSLNFTKKRQNYVQKQPMLLLFLCWLVLPPKLSFQSPQNYELLHPAAILIVVQ